MEPSVHPSINPFSFYHRFSCAQGRGGDGAWTRQWLIAGPRIDQQPPPHDPSHTHTQENSELLIRLMCKSLDCGKRSGMGFEPTTFLLCASPCLVTVVPLLFRTIPAQTQRPGYQGRPRQTIFFTLINIICGYIFNIY